ncbi:MAG: hypothetical protein AAFP68_19700, partial [Pseudomonadota bacterium]
LRPGLTHETETVPQREHGRAVNDTAPQPALSFPSGTPFAKGGIISGGVPVTPFASGGIVNSPTMFPLRNGLGLMGEAGPEAIMPVARGPDGKMGVRAVGGGKSDRSITISPTYIISGLGLSAAEVASMLDRNNRQLPALLRDYEARGL